MDAIFDLCVNILLALSKMLGITYEQLNVLLFVIIHPAITLALFVITLVLFRKYRKYKKLLSEQQNKK
jgi:hypothetical protein